MLPMQEDCESKASLGHITNSSPNWITEQRNRTREEGKDEGNRKRKGKKEEDTGDSGT